MADTFSPLLNLRLQQTGNNQNTWGDLLNSDTVTPIENAIAGRALHTVTGGALDLSATPLVEQVHVFTGTLTSDLTVTVPTLNKRMLVQNGCGGNFAVLLKTSGGTPIAIPANTVKDVYVNFGGVFRADAPDVGKIEFFGRTTTPAGYLLCDGTAISRTAYPDLFAAIGTTWGAGNGATTFNIPDLTTNNRYLRASAGSLNVGQTQTDDVKPHNHTASGSTSTSVSLTIAADGNHTHPLHVSDPGHGHGVTGGTFGGTTGGALGPGAISAPINSAAAISISANTTGVGVTEDPAGNHSHSGSSASASSSTSVTVNNSSGTETRPHTAIALACIRF